MKKMLMLSLMTLSTLASAATLSVEGRSTGATQNYSALSTESGWMWIGFDLMDGMTAPQNLTLATSGLPEGVTLKALSQEQRGDQLFVQVAVERTEAAKMMNINHLATVMLVSGDVILSKGTVTVYGADYSGL